MAILRYLGHGGGRLRSHLPTGAVHRSTGRHIARHGSGPLSRVHLVRLVRVVGRAIDVGGLWPRAPSSPARLGGGRRVHRSRGYRAVRRRTVCLASRQPTGRAVIFGRQPGQYPGLHRDIRCGVSSATEPGRPQTPDESGHGHPAERAIWAADRPSLSAAARCGARSSRSRIARL